MIFSKQLCFRNFSLIYPTCINITKQLTSSTRYGCTRPLCEYAAIKHQIRSDKTRDGQGYTQPRHPAPAHVTQISEHCRHVPQNTHPQDSYSK